MCDFLRISDIFDIAEILLVLDRQKNGKMLLNINHKFPWLLIPAGIQGASNVENSNCNKRQKPSPKHHLID